MPLSHRLRLALLWVIAALVVLSNAAYLIYLLTVPHDGVAVGAFGFIRPEGVGVRFILPGGTDAVQKDDVVTHINGRSLDAWLGADYSPDEVWNVDGPVTYTVRRLEDPANPEGPRQELTVTATSDRLSPLRVLFHLPTLTLLGLTFGGVALLAFTRRPRDLSAQLFWIIGLNLFMIGLNDPVDYQMISVTRPPVFWAHFFMRDMVLNMAGMAAALGLAMTFPRRFAFVKRNSKWLFPLIAVVALGTPWVVYALNAPGLARVVATIRAMLVIMIAYLLGTVILFVANFFAIKDPVQRAQLRWVSWGIAVGVLPVVVGFMLPGFAGLRPLPFELIALTLLAVPFSFAMAIARYRLWDIDVVINRSIVYSIVGVVLGASYLGIVTALQRVMVSATGTESDLAVVSSTVVIAGLFLPVRDRVQTVVNQTLFADQYRARESLRQFSRQVSNLVDLQLLLNQLLEHVCRPMNASVGFVLLARNDHEDATYETAVTYGDPPWTIAIRPDDKIYPDLKRGRLVAEPTGEGLAGVALAVPMVAFGELEGVLALGERDAEQDYNADDHDALRDVADQAALAIRVARLQEDLIIAERLSAVGGAASAIVHDLKNQIGAAGGYAELLTRTDISVEDRARFARILRDVMSGFSVMATEILDLARGESHVKIEPVEVPEFMAGLLPLVERLCEQADITLDLKLGYQGTMPMDVQRLQRVFFNLCDNAHDALLVVKPPEGRRITLANGLDDEWVVFRVSDNGPGVPPEIHDSLFDPFVSAQKSGGTGLGLAIAKKVVEAHGGEIALDEDAAEGATFVVRLPLN